MDWGQILVSLITVAGLFLWNRGESRSDIRNMDAKIDENKKIIIEIHNQTKDMIAALDKETKNMISSFQQVMFAEMKDFHGRLCALEERRLNNK